MKRKMWAAALAASMVMSAFSGMTVSAAEADSDLSGTLTILSWYDETKAAPVLEAFKEKYPNVNVDFQYSPPVQDYVEKLSTLLYSGAGPDIFYMALENREDLIKGGYCLDLSDESYMTDGTIPDSVKTTYGKDGKAYALAVDCWVGGILVNQDRSETLSNTAGDYAELSFTGTGITVYGPWDILYGMCNVYLDGELWKKDVSQYPPKVDFPGMSRGYEKRYRQILAEVHGLEEKKHTLRIEVTGTKEAKAQNTYTSIDYAVLEGSSYTGGFKMNIAVDFNYPRMVRGCVRRPDVKLIPGVRESFRIQMLLEEDK